MTRHRRTGSGRPGTGGSEGCDLSGLEPTPSGDGTRLRLRVKPAARRSAILGVHGGALKVAVTAAPEKGKANRAVLAVLAEALDVPPSSLELLSGAGSHDKAVRVPLPPAEVLRRLGGSSPADTP